MARLTAAKAEQEARARREKREPFEYETANGQVLVFRDPKSLQYLELRKLGKEDIDSTMKILLGDEGYELFANLPEVDGYFMDMIFEQWGEHYNAPDSGE